MFILCDISNRQKTFPWVVKYFYKKGSLTFMLQHSSLYKNSKTFEIHPSTGLEEIFTEGKKPTIPFLSYPGASNNPVINHRKLAEKTFPLSA
jgi:hypothetical protein